MKTFLTIIYAAGQRRRHGGCLNHIIKKVNRVQKHMFGLDFLAGELGHV